MQCSVEEMEVDFRSDHRLWIGKRRVVDILKNFGSGTDQNDFSCKDLSVSIILFP